MRDHDQRAGVFHQCHAERLPHFNVQVVGRLIQQQQIGLLPDHQRQDKARLFSTRKRRHRLKDAFSTKTESPEVGALVRFTVFPCIVLQVIHGAHFRM